MSTRLVSIVIPCYRQAHYLAGAIESAFGQRYAPIQVVVNDGSDDDTPAVAARYGLRIDYVAKAHGGLSSARNAGIQAARGRYLLFLDADDLLHPDAVAWLAEALSLAWSQEPDLTLVCVGGVAPADRAAWSALWGERADRVRWIDPVAKPAMYAILARAEAAVLPTLVDNLPNTVIESLMLGVPVVGTDGASVDELVEPGVTGELVPVGDVRALAAALVRAWRGQLPARRGFAWRSPVAEQMHPEVAVRNLLDLAGPTGRVAPR